MDDVRTVMDAVGIHQASIVGAADGGMMAALFADISRAGDLVGVGQHNRRCHSGRIPTGVLSANRAAIIGMVEQGWGGSNLVYVTNPSLGG